MTVFEHIDGDILGTEEKEIRGFMRDNNLLSGDRVCFTGMVSLERSLHFFYPKTFVVDADADKFDRAKILVNCIRKYSLNKGNPVTFGANKDEKRPVGIPPVTAIELLDDFMKSGLYSNAEAEIKRRNSGRILWGRTIKNSIPFIRKDGSPVYTDLYVGRTNYAADNDVTNIHAAIIAKLDEMFGWYFTGREDVFVASEFSECNLPYRVEKCISVIRKEMATVFSDREIRLLKNLIGILEEERLSERHTSFLSGVCNFEHVWEEMCSEIYGNQLEEIKDKVAYPAYVDGNGKINNRSKHRMDIVISDESREKLAILDAKYYDFKNSPPGWSDLVKQFYYKRVLAAVMHDKKIENFFVAPGSAASDMPHEARLYNNDIPFLENEFTPIRIIYLDTEEVIRCYLDPHRTNNLREEVFGHFGKDYIVTTEGTSIS